MADQIHIALPEEYIAPTEKEISKAKKWTLLRNENAAHLSSLIEELLQNAARELTKIGYKYGVPPEQFEFSADKNLREDVAALMNELEDDIFSLIEEYSLNETEDKKRRNSILPWLLALHSKGTKNLKETLHQRLTQFLFDTEAQIAAMKLAKYNQTKAIGRVLSTMHTAYVSPEMQAAFKKKSAARYIQSKGIHYGNVGLSSSGAVNVENFGDMTAKMAWSQLQYEEAKEDGKDGYFCFRGSTYPCSPCDDVCSVFHTMDEGMVLPVHGHCCCYAVFVGMKGQKNTIQKKVVPQSMKERRKEIIKEAISEYKESTFENKDVTWNAVISNKNIREWINQPHRNYYEKNEALLDLEQLFRNANYIGNTIDPKQLSGERPNVEKSHIFETYIGGQKSWIIVHEMKWGEYQIHSISDNNPLR